MSMDNKLQPIKWEDAQLAPINKNVYVEHEDVKAQPTADVKAWRAKHGITVKGSGCPNPTLSFDHSSFTPEIIKLLKNNFENPTPIQAQGWPLALSGKDMVGSSQTGSGKTIGFTLPGLAHIQAQLKLQPHRWSDGPIALVLAPTRELALQIIADTRPYLNKMGLKSAALFGGAPRGAQQSSLQQGPHLVVATPGRLIDFLSDGSTNLSRCTYIVLDEADRMLDMGFEPQIRQIMSQLRPDRQTLMWSATWPTKVQALASEFFQDPITIHVGSTELRANPNVTQKIHITSEYDKHNKATSLIKEIHKDGPVKTLIFCATKEMADRLSYGLQDAGFGSAASIHGGKSQILRMKLLSQFRDGHVMVLVATDVAARGLDIDNVQHVINYDFPTEIEDYIHRIGRTGRAGRTGTAHTFLSHERHPGKVVHELIKVLRDAKQDITPELSQFSSSGGYSPQRRSYGGGSRGGSRGGGYGYRR